MATGRLKWSSVFKVISVLIVLVGAYSVPLIEMTGHDQYCGSEAFHQGIIHWRSPRSDNPAPEISTALKKCRTVGVVVIEPRSRISKNEGDLK